MLYSLCEAARQFKSQFIRFHGVHTDVVWRFLLRSKHIKLLNGLMIGRLVPVTIRLSSEKIKFYNAAKSRHVIEIYLFQTRSTSSFKFDIMRIININIYNQNMPLFSFKFCDQQKNTAFFTKRSILHL